MSVTAPPRRGARWSRLLTWHLAVVVAATAAMGVSSVMGLEVVSLVAGTLAAVLGLPWSALAPLVYLDLGPANWVWTAAWLLPPFVNVVLHQRLVVFSHARDQRTAAPAISSTSSPAQPDALDHDHLQRGHARSAEAGVADARVADARVAARVVAFAGCALLGAGIWGAWLGWDTTYYTVPGVPEPQGPYTPAQVVACAVSVAVATAAAARWRNPVVAAGGITFGFWVPWSAQAAAGPLSGSLWAIGSALLLFALVAGTGVVAVAGYASRRWHPPAPARLAQGAPGQWWRTSAALVVVAGCWLLAGAVVRLALPLAWTYLMVLRVPLDLAALGAVATGVVLAVRSARTRRAAGQRLRPLALPAALLAVLVLAVLTARVIPAGNGFNGHVGVMAGPDGAPVAVIGLCRGSADSLVVLDLDSDLAQESWNERGEEAQAAVLEHDGALDGIAVVDLGDPGPGWAGSTLGQPATGEERLNITATGRQSLLSDTYFTRAEVVDLAPGMVTYSVWEQPNGPYTGNEQVPLDDFAEVACSGRGRNG